MILINAWGEHRSAWLLLDAGALFDVLVGWEGFSQADPFVLNKRICHLADARS